MNPLTFFPPPSRSLSRVDSRPTMNNNGTTVGSSSGSSSREGSMRSSRRGLQPLTSSNSASKLPTLATTGSRQRASSGTQTFDGSSSGTSSGQVSGATTPELKERQQQQQQHQQQRQLSNSVSDIRSLNKRPVTSPTHSSDALSNAMVSSIRSGDTGKATGYGSDSEAQRSRQGSGFASPQRSTGFTLQQQQKNKRTSSKSQSHASSSGGRLGHRLPQGLYFDLVRPNEVAQAHKLEKDNYNVDDAATIDTFRYRQKAASHLFLGAFLPLPPPKVSGPLSMSGPTPRKLIGYACGTAASALTARAIKHHADDEHAWLVCLHSVCVAPEYRHKGLALKLIEEYIRRLRRIEEGRGGADAEKKGYESVACLAHEETIPLFKKAGFKTLGVSHVSVGSGGWFELRRPILPQDQDEEDDETASSSRASDRTDTHDSSPVGIVSPPDLAASDKEAANTTPTQELDRRLQAHADAISSANVAEKGDETFNILVGGVDGENAGETTENGELHTSPLAMSPIQSSLPLPLPLSIDSPTTPDNDTEAAPPAQSEKSDVPPVDDATQGAQSTPMPFTTSQIMQALREQSGAAKTTGKGNGYQNKEPRSPGVAYSAIMGQTLASKTSVEDAFFALEARLVNRDDQTNLADLYCPREECAGLLLKAGTADWDIAEIGPLHQANLHPTGSLTPPTAPVPRPPTAALEHVRSALGSTRPASSSTAAQAFWIVRSPMLFENIGFSKDTEWKVPPTHSASISSVNSDGTANASTASHHSDGSGASGSGHANGGGAERKKSTKRNSIFRATSEWIREKDRARADRRATLAANGGGEGNDRESNGDLLSPTSAAAGSGAQQGQTVKVKFLTCAECDCGPLGYTVLPQSMENGAFARDVGKQMQSQGGQTSAVQEQLFFVASDRVRYRLLKQA